MGAVLVDRYEPLHCENLYARARNRIRSHVRNDTARPSGHTPRMAGSTTEHATLTEWLEQVGAHHDVVSWAAPFGEAWAAALSQCPRGDWLLGIGTKLGAPHRSVVTAAAECARTCLDIVPDDEPLPADSLEVVLRWARDEATEEEVRQCIAKLEAADPPDPAVAAAVSAALAAACSVLEAEHAPGAPANAAQATVFAVGDCAMMAALRHAQSSCADIVRAQLDFPTLVAELSQRR